MHIISFSFGVSVNKSVNSLPNRFKFSTVVVEKRTSGYIGMTSSISLNWNISVIYCRIELKPALAKSDFYLHLYFNMICYKINLVLNKMEETFQSNALDWSSLVIIISCFFLSKEKVQRQNLLNLSITFWWKYCAITSLPFQWYSQWSGYFNRCTEIYTFMTKNIWNRS